MTTTRLLEAADERRVALRALLARPFVDADDPAFALVRRHEHELARTCAQAFGYRLEVGATAARVPRVPTAAGLRRPVRVRPASESGRRRAPDEWPELSDRATVLLFLTLAALERVGAQIPIAELARTVQIAGADADPPIPVDFDARAERLAFADGLDVLCDWGVLEQTGGSRASYARAEQDADEALFTIDRRRLALLLRDPFAALGAERVDDLLDESAQYAPGPDGDRRALAHRLARRLLEDPALVLADLDEDERAYFLGQRARIESRVEQATGLAVERRAEGSALIADTRDLTDRPFPTNSTVKQAALLLCELLAAAPRGERLPAARLRDATKELMARHRAHWQRDPGDPAAVDALLHAATAVLCDLDLATPAPGGGLLPRPLCARYRSPALRCGGEGGE